jgi:hypothetical protein
MATGPTVSLMLDFIVLNENIARQVLTRSLYMKSTALDHDVFTPNISDNTALVFRSIVLARPSYTVTKQPQ